jgi:hypothetical protein
LPRKRRLWPVGGHRKIGGEGRAVRGQDRHHRMGWQHSVYNKRFSMIEYK